MDDTLLLLRDYIDRGWHLFPLRPQSKEPRFNGGFKRATNNFHTIETWYKTFTGSNWGLYPEPSGLIVIDIDAYKAGCDPNALGRLPDTLLVRTGNGGLHLYYSKPSGTHISNSNDGLPYGWDVRCSSGYVVLPPSITDKPYEWGNDLPIVPLPEILLAVITKKEHMMIEKPAKIVRVDEPEAIENQISTALSCLKALKKSRADDYDDWLNVGMSLFELGEAGLDMWDNWSKQSDKYEFGKCEQKWLTFTSGEMDKKKITFGSLVHWADEDDCVPHIRPAPKKTKSSDYSKVLTAFGYSFSQNDMNDMFYINGTKMSDVMMSVIMYQLREYEYKSVPMAQDAIAYMAHQNLFHPIKDYLHSVKWDGQDHISQLCSFFQDKDGVFPVLIRKWLVGAVERVLGSRPGQQHPMLVLDGVQGIGKSRFVWWLGSPLPAFQIQSAINTTDKDFLIQLCSKFVWEVEELDTTIRRAEVGSLKAFLSKEVIDVRKPYGHDTITKPATASFIGTINNTGGFLADPSGSRRFRVCTLTKIDWNYDKLDVNQIWAQAVSLFEAGETWQLDKEMNQKMMEINDRYDVDDPIAFDILEHYEVNPAVTDKVTSTSQIIHLLRDDNKLIGGSDILIAQRISGVLVHLGCEKVRCQINGIQTRGWKGVYLKS